MTGNSKQVNEMMNRVVESSNPFFKITLFFLILLLLLLLTTLPKLIWFCALESDTCMIYNSLLPMSHISDKL